VSSSTNCRRKGHGLERGRGLCVWWGVRWSALSSAATGIWCSVSLNRRDDIVGVELRARVKLMLTAPDWMLVAIA